VSASLDFGYKSKAVIELVQLMRSEIQQRRFEDPSNELNYNSLFRLFVSKRKIKLLRYLFSLHNEFSFQPPMFVWTLDLEAYDMACLIYKEF